jgi:hypothetical protein
VLIQKIPQKLEITDSTLIIIVGSDSESSIILYNSTHCELRSYALTSFQEATSK